MCIVANHIITHAFISDEKPIFSLVVGVNSIYEKTLHAQMNEVGLILKSDISLHQMHKAFALLIDHKTITEAINVCFDTRLILRIL